MMEDPSSLETFQALEPVKFLREFTSENVRPDGRPLHRVRPTTIVRGVLRRNASGSALIRLGETRVVAGTTLLVGRPSASRPSHGEVEVSLAVGPVCSPRMGGMGRPIPRDGGGGGLGGNGGLDDSQVLESYLQRTLVSSGVVDMKDLSIREGRCAWKIRISVVCLNHDGNIVDAAFLAAVAALADTRLPDTVVSGDGTVSVVVPDDDGGRGGGTPLKLRCVPVPLTVGVFDGKLLADPSAREEEVLDSSVTVVTTGEGHVISVNKAGGTAMPSEDMAACMQLASGRAREVEPIIKS